MKTSKKILASALAAAMVMSTGVMTCADDYAGQTQAVPSIVATTNEDGTVTLTLSAKGNVTKFDFGIGYDPATMTVVPYVDPVTEEEEPFEYDASFKPLTKVATSNDQTKYGYIVLGGASTAAKAENYDGVIGTVTFEVEDGAKVNATVVRDSIKVKTAIDAGTTESKDFSTVVKNEADKVDGMADDPDTTITDYEPVIPTVDPTDDPTQPTDPTGEQPTQPSGEQPTQPTTGGDQPTTTQPAAGGDQPTTTTAAPATTTTAPGSTKTKSGKTGDASSVVLPIVAICGAAAAVAVASKKRVED